VAKGQKRSNRETKKPKADKKKLAAMPTTVSSVLSKPKSGVTEAEKKK
jgi:hypothetical protein